MDGDFWTDRSQPSVGGHGTSQLRAAEQLAPDGSVALSLPDTGFEGYGGEGLRATRRRMGRRVGSG